MKKIVKKFFVMLMLISVDKGITGMISLLVISCFVLAVSTLYLRKNIINKD